MPLHLRSLTVTGRLLAGGARRSLPTRDVRPLSGARRRPVHRVDARWTSGSSDGAGRRPPRSDGSAAAVAPADDVHRPPFPVRVALVSATTALATPSFPVLGFLYVAARYTVPDAGLRRTMEGRWGALLSFATWTLLPQMYGGTAASLILPCAIGNAAAAGGAYALVDAACGGPGGGSSDGARRVLRTPFLAGSGIGAAVGYVAPHYAYGPVLERLYVMEGASQTVASVMSVPGVTSASVATGAIAGMLLHPMLYYPINGMPGVHWGYFSGTALAAATAALVYVYRAREDSGLPVPRGSFVEPSEVEIANSIVRYNNASGTVETYSLEGGKFVGRREKCVEGRTIADASRSYSGSGKAVFDDRLLAFVYNFWDEGTATRYPEHVVNIKTRRELQTKQDSMALTDASVAAILLDDNDDECADRHGDAAGGAKRSSDVSKVLETINELGDESKGKRPSLEIKKLEEVSAAIQLLMTMKQVQDQTNIDIIPTLEKFTRRRCPELTLYASEEQYEGESVESQLLAANWKGPGLHEARRRWERVHRNDVHRTWRNRAIIVATGVIISVAGSILQGNI